MRSESAFVFVAFLLAACSPSSGGSRGGSFSTVAPATSSLPRSVSPVRSATPAATTSTASASYPTPADLARRHAPLYRFNAWIPTSSSICNKSEDYFPMSVRSFFEQLAAGTVRVVTIEADQNTVGLNEEVALGATPKIDAAAIRDTPIGLTGDEPGTAPVYFHVYEDAKARVRNADGSGSDLWFVEYWLFYPQDASRERVFALGIIFDVGGHKGDWEATTFAVRVTLGPGGAFLSSDVVKGYYSGHGDKQEAELADMTVVNGHPVGFIAVGKHATYPEPGYWTDIFGMLPLAIHDEYFLGNGYAWESWKSPLIDLEDKNNAAEFAPPAFAKLRDPALAATGLTDWRSYKGTWGDSQAFSIPLINFSLPFGDSPDGPWQKGSYGSGAKSTKKWSDVKRTASGLELKSFAPVVPPPVPYRK